MTAVNAKLQTHTTDEECVRGLLQEKAKRRTPKAILGRQWIKIGKGKC
jgi:hypothetical protein